MSLVKLAKWVKDQGHGGLAILARETDLAYNTVHEIFAGKRRASPGSALAIQRATGGVITLEDLASVTVTRPTRRRAKRAATRRPRRRPRTYKVRGKAAA